MLALWMIMKSSRMVPSIGNGSLINSLVVAPLLMITRDLCFILRKLRKFAGEFHYKDWEEMTFMMSMKAVDGANVRKHFEADVELVSAGEEINIIVSGQWRDLTPRRLRVT